MNGLRDEYGAEIDFRYLDANGDGAALFREYRLRYHPAYIIVGPDGTEVWRALGERPEAELREAIQDVLDRAPGSDAAEDRGATIVTTTRLS